MRTARSATLTAGLTILTAALEVFTPGTSHAEPYMAIREGRRCSACHTNMAGGGKRSELATTHLQEITRYRDLFPQLAEATETFNGQVTKFFSVGADVRLTNTVVLQDEPDANGEVANDTAFRGRVEENILELRRGLAYGQLDLIPDYLTLYADVLVTSGGSFVGREVFGLARGLLPGRGYVKAGRFFPEYGLRTENDDLFSRNNDANRIFVRGRTGTDFTDFAEGAEIGFEPGPFHFASSITNGSSGDADVRWTLTGYSVLRDLPVVKNLLLGASVLRTDANNRWAYGFFAGSNLGRLAYQAEVDFLTDRSDDGRFGTFLAYGELNYLAFDWINCKAFGEYSDNDSDPRTNDDAQNRFGVGVEPFLGRFLQARLFYSVANGVPQRPEDNQDRIVLELHLFL